MRRGSVLRGPERTPSGRKSGATAETEAEKPKPPKSERLKALWPEIWALVRPRRGLLLLGLLLMAVNRVAGLVLPGSLRSDPATREQRFALSDGKASVPVKFQGIPPDLFGEGRGAVVEGTLGADGTFVASTILAKHSEEYRAPHDGQTGYQALIETLRGAGTAAAAGPAGAAKP